MAQPSTNYFVFPTPTSTPFTPMTPTSTPSTPFTPLTTPTTSGKLDLNNRNYVTKDALCLYTAQGQIICNKNASQLPIAPFANEYQEKK